MCTKLDTIFWIPFFITENFALEINITLIQVLIINCIYNYICNSGGKIWNYKLFAFYLESTPTRSLTSDICFRYISNSFTNIPNKLYLRYLRETCVLDKSISIIDFSLTYIATSEEINIFITSLFKV